MASFAAKARKGIFLVAHMGEVAEPALSVTLYRELRGLAAAQLRRERPGHTLQPTALVHEAFLRLRQQRNADGADRPTLLAIAARQMRQLLVDHARGRRRLKRGGGGERFTLDARDLAADAPAADVLDLHEALDRLADLNPRQSEVVTLRFFGGLTAAEAAETLDVSVRTVEGDWAFARAWLRRELADDATAKEAADEPA